MNLSRLKQLLLALVGGTVILLFLFLSLQTNQTVTAITASTLDRPEDPVVVTGADLAAFDGQPLDELKLYTFDGSSWSTAPFQFDERLNDITGTYVISEDGLLDANDELAFMAKDAGQMAGGDDWPSDMEAQSNPRVMITINDPLSPGDMGWAYLYRSTTLATDPTSYVDWNQALQTITALSYTASFTSDFVGLADLSINGNGVDILDRQKIRIETFLITIDEETLSAVLTSPITIPVVGPVRGVANGNEFNISIYGARLDSTVNFDANDYPVPLPPIQSVRTSFDLNDPAVTGITNYFNGNGITATIDGVPDFIDAFPLADWFQTSGSAGGMVVAVREIDSMGAENNYYLDDSAVDPNDTGDQRSFGDSGLLIQNPGDVIGLSLVTFILPPNSMASVGAEYFDRMNNPLTVTTQTQVFGQSEFIFIPVVLKP